MAKGKEQAVMTTQRIVILAGMLAFAAPVLSGCGQKGPLERPAEVAVQPAVSFAVGGRDGLPGT